ncbi:MAG: CDP-glycerol glycerophosphotransferase family protein [Lachnospiraceae bacterium]|nr:CDP-glycerol glycerophosphotransferase family protein [Lachnospiraceae bacterium]
MKKIKKGMLESIRWLMLKLILPGWYKLWCICPVNEKSAVFIEVKFPEVSDNFIELQQRMKEKYQITNYFLRNSYVGKIEYFKRCFHMLKGLARAKYAFVNEANYVLGTIHLRKETKLVQTWHACGAYKKFGYSSIGGEFGASKSDKLRYPTHRNYTLVPVSSPAIVWAYEEAMGIEGTGIVQPLGVSRTDLFFQDSYIEKARKKLEEKIPAAKEKKCILYAPTFRGNVGDAENPNEIDLSAFRENFQDEYILLLKFHPLASDSIKIKEEDASFAYDLTKDFTVNELLCTCDICISDYSSLIFEYAIFKKPIFLFTYDLDAYYNDRGFYYDIKTMLPGSLCMTNEELIDKIKHIESYDMDCLERFREKYMASCDGKATDRILKYIGIE